jgi:hypothetical protein
VVFHSDGSIDVGRAQRTFTSRQRVALGAIWGGCAFPDCDRPPLWCEAHHATPWSHGGRTDVNNGVLLCRHHHMLVHDNGWAVRPPGSTPQASAPRGSTPQGSTPRGSTLQRVNRSRAEGWMLHPPPGDPLHRVPIELESKHPARLVRRQRGGGGALDREK